MILLLFIGSSLYARSPKNEWPIFRGRADLSGKTDNLIPASPKLLWIAKTNSKTLSSPVVQKEIIYFGNNDGEVYAIRADAKVSWKYKIESAIEAAPLVFDNRVIFGAMDGILRSVDATTGKLIWEYETENRILGSANIWQSGGKELVIVGSYDNYLHAVVPSTGKPVWKIETENYIHGTPAIFKNNVVFGGCDGILRVVNAFNGQLIGNHNLQVYLASSPAISANRAFIGDYDGGFFAIDLNTHKLVWKKEKQSDLSVLLATPAVDGGRAVIGSEDKVLYCYDTETGDILWKFRTNGRITGSAVISQDNVLFCSRDGTINIVSLKTGRKKWGFDTGKPVSSTPAVIEKRFYVLTEDGRLLAFGEDMR